MQPSAAAFRGARAGRPGWRPGSFLTALGTVAAVVALLYASCRSHNLYTVVDVSDGDTFCVQDGDGIRVVQLAGADAPELHKNEPFAQQARYYLMDRILHRRVRLQTLDSDQPNDYKDRWICWVWLGPENLSYTMVHHGLARFSGAAGGEQRSELLRLEKVARTGGLGMWIRTAEPAGFSAGPNP